MYKKILDKWVLFVCVSFFFNIEVVAQEQDCESILASYYSMDLESMEELKNSKQSKLEKKIYKKVLKEKRILAKLQARNQPRFSIERDDFVDLVEYKTSLTNIINESKSTCYAGKFYKNYSNPSVNDTYWDKVRVRKNCDADVCTAIQAVFYSASTDRLPWQKIYFGINKAAVKGLGEVEFSKIDISTDILEYSNSFHTRYFLQLAVNLTDAQFLELTNIDSDPEVRFYSSAGRDINYRVPLNHIRTFAEGMREAGQLPN